VFVLPQAELENLNVHRIGSTTHAALGLRNFVVIVNNLLKSAQKFVI